MTGQEILQILTGFLGTCAFGILFNIRGKYWIFAVLGGFFSWTLFVVLGLFWESEPLRYFLVSVLISAYAEILARVLKTPTTTFIITALIPLIPGGSLYYTMSYAISGSWNDFMPSALSTIQLAVALALGIVLTTAAAAFTAKLESGRRGKSKGETV